MAEFCRACSIKTLGFNSKDLAGLTTPEAWSSGLAQRELCEGCGSIQVDPDGNCVSPGCLRAGEPGHGLPWVGEPGYPGEPAAEPSA